MISQRPNVTKNASKDLTRCGSITVSILVSFCQVAVASMNAHSLARVRVISYVCLFPFWSWRKQPTNVWLGLMGSDVWFWIFVFDWRLTREFCISDYRFRLGSAPLSSANKKFEPKLIFSCFKTMELMSVGILAKITGFLASVGGGNSHYNSKKLFFIVR